MPGTGPAHGGRARLLCDLSAAAHHCTAAQLRCQQALADHFGLHLTDVQCLAALGAESGPVTIGRVGELTGLSTGAATRLVDRLERAGYVTRARDPADRRRVLVTTAPQPMADFGRVRRALDGAWRHLLDGYDDEHLAVLLVHLRRAVELADAQIAMLRAGGGAATAEPARRTAGGSG